jgi:T5SS/PEP-CTERM-associated repeat protein
MRRFSLACVVLVVLFPATVRAAITSWGDVTHPWSQNGPDFVGYSTAGTVTVNGGSRLSSGDLYIGAGTTRTGVVTISGSGSSLVVSGSLYVSYGTLKIYNGGSISVSDATCVGSGSASTGTIDFGTNGGTLTTRSLVMLPIQLMGTGMINAHGLISDINLVFDSTHGLKQTLIFNSQGQNVTVNLDMSGGSASNGWLGAGYFGNSSVTIRDGVTVQSSGSWIGDMLGSKGTVTVSGSGSTWTNSGASLYVGGDGSGTLNVLNGGAVNSTDTYIGGGTGSTGIATISGTGSTWNNGSQYIGFYGGGTLNITNAGTLHSTMNSFIGYGTASTGIITVSGNGSTWNSNSGTTTASNIFVGYNGHGTLRITNGGSVTVIGTTFVAYGTSSTGTIDFGTSSGILSPRTLAALPTGLSGTGTINARGLISDFDLVFDSTHGLSRTLTYNSQGQNVIVNLDLSGGSANGDLGAGWKGTGSLTFKDGVAVVSSSGYLGYLSGSKGMATVSGSGTIWTNAVCLHVGCSSSSGTLSITNAGTVSSGEGSIGRGNITVSGSGSVWTLGGYQSGDGDLGIGYYGAGTLNITNSGVVSCRNGYLGNGTSSISVATVSGSGSIWAISGNFSIGNAKLNITNGGLVNSTVGSINSNATGAGIVVSGAGSAWNISGGFSIGESSGGTLSIAAGGSVTCGRASGFIDIDGHNSTGLAKISGSGSTWNINRTFYLGIYGSAILNISNGGIVNCNYPSIIGYNAGSNGMATVSGSGSIWYAWGLLSVGSSGTATANICGGGTIVASSVAINGYSLLSIDVGRDSVLSTIDGSSAGAISNSGKIRILAGAGVAAGATYTPIVSGAWSGTGTYQDVGGTLNTTTHVFTVSNVLAGSAASAVLFDRSAVQRVLIADHATGGTGWSVGASFLRATSSSTMTFTASTMGAATLASLKSSLDANQWVSCGWNFSAAGYTPSPATPVYLSFNVGSGKSLDAIEIWHYSGSVWSEYAASDLTYDGAYASFTASGFSGYAVVLPEPGMFAILAVGLAGFLAYSRRKGRQCSDLNQYRQQLR